MEYDLQQKLNQIDGKLNSLDNKANNALSIARSIHSKTGMGCITFILLLAGAYGGCQANWKAEGIEKELKRLEARNNVRTENVIGGEAPERFCEINGQRAYLEIDGKPVESYFPR